MDKVSYRKYVSFINCITDILKDYDISVKYNGYSYIIDAVMIIIDLKRFDIRLVNDVYPYIRQKYALKSEATVEHNIRNAIKMAYIKCHTEFSDSRMMNYDKKPTNKQFLLSVSNDVFHKMRVDSMS